MKYEVKNFGCLCSNIRVNNRVVYHCTEEESINDTNHHLLIFCAKKSGAGGVGGWMVQPAGLRFAYSDQKA